MTTRTAEIAQTITVFRKDWKKFVNGSYLKANRLLENNIRTGIINPKTGGTTQIIIAKIEFFRLSLFIEVRACPRLVS